MEKIKLRFGTANEPLMTCTGCNRQSIKVGDEILNFTMRDCGGFGPVCVDCWPDVEDQFGEIAEASGMVFDVETAAEEVMTRYEKVIRRRERGAR